MKFIERRKGVMGGSWIFKKTRVPVKMMYQHIYVLKDYTLKQVQALWGFIAPEQIKGGLSEYKKIHRIRKILKWSLAVLLFLVVEILVIIFLGYFNLVGGKT